MQTVQKFTFPTFMGICSILAACADILQNPAIFAGILIALFGIGAISILVPARWVTSKLADTVGFDQLHAQTIWSLMPDAWRVDLCLLRTVRWSRG